MVMAEACLLAQFSDKAYKKLNDLIYHVKIERTLTNPAGYLHSKMKEIRHAIEEEMGIATEPHERRSSQRPNVHHQVDGTRPSHHTWPSNAHAGGAWHGAPAYRVGRRGESDGDIVSPRLSAVCFTARVCNTAVQGASRQGVRASAQSLPAV